MKVKKLIQALIKEEMDPRRPKDKAFDLAQQLSKLSPEDREKVAMIQQMIYKEKMDKDDYGRSISGKDKSTFVDPEDLMPAARAKKLAGMEDDEMETRYDYDDPIFEAKFKEGDTVIPNIGPHKGVKHKIIYDFGNGKYNIQPIGLRPNQIQYRLGAASASEDQLKMADDVNEEIERPFFANQKYYDELNDLRDKGLLKSGISSLQSKFNLSREKAKEIFNKYLEDLKAEQPEAFDFFMKDLNEGDTYEKMAAKGKKAGNLKQGTVRKRLRIKDGEKIPLARINKAISGLKKRKSLSDKDKKYLKALNLAKTLKTTTNVKEIATELGYLKEEDRFAGFADKPTNKKDYVGRGLNKLKRAIKNPVSKDPELNKTKLTSYQMGQLYDFKLLRKNVSQMLDVEVDDRVRSGTYNGREGYNFRISSKDLKDWSKEQIEKLKQAFKKTNSESEDYEFEYNGVSDFEIEPGERNYPASFDYFATRKE